MLKLVLRSFRSSDTCDCAARMIPLNVLCLLSFDNTISYVSVTCEAIESMVILFPSHPRVRMAPML